MNVPGKKIIVSKAIPFMAELSRLEAAANSNEFMVSAAEYLERLWLS